MKSKSHALSVVMIHKKECFVAYACVMHFSASSCIHMGLCAIEMSVILILIILTVIYIPRPIHRRICTSRCSQKQADLFRGPVRELQLVEPMEDLFRGPVRELQLVEPMEDLFRGPVRELQLVEPMEDLFRGPIRELQLVEPMEDLFRGPVRELQLVEPMEDLFRGPVRELQLVEPMEDLFRGPVRELQLVEPMEDTGGSGRMKLNEEGGCETSRSMAGHCCQVTS